MIVPELGRIERLKARDIWGHEARGLTPWLLENSDVLADVLGIELELTAAEHPVGPFALDIIGRDLTHDCVLVVENQLEATDHDHLGKLLTYAAGTEAGTVVWLAPRFREEHRAALDWLNRLGGEKVRFFGVQPEVVRIAGQVAIAPLFELSAQPNDWTAAQAAAARSSPESERGDLYRAFWERLIDRQHSEHPAWATRRRKPPAHHWLTYSTPFGTRGNYTLVAANLFLRSELYLKGDDLFPMLEVHRAKINAAYGSQLDWQELPDRQGSRICEKREADLADHARWNEYVEWLLDSQARLRAAVAPYADAAPLAQWSTESLFEGEAE